MKKRPSKVFREILKWIGLAALTVAFTLILLLGADADLSLRRLGVPVG